MPRRMTKAQWLAGPRKSGTYAAYSKWYANRQRPQPGTASDTNPWYLSPLTQREFNKRVEAETIRRYKPQRQQIEREATYRNKTIQAASEAASALLAQHAPITQQAYSQATADVAGIGQGYSTEMAAKVDAAQKAAQSFGQSQGVGTEAPTVDTAALHDAGYYAGASIPGSSLAAQGANWTALQNAQAGIPLLQGASDIRQVQSQSEADLLALAQKRPEIRSQVVQEFFKQEMDKLSARIQQQAQDTISGQFGETVRHHQATEQAATNRNRISWKKALMNHQDAIDKAAAEGRQPDPSLSRAYGHIVDGNGKPILNNKGQMIPYASTATAKDKAGKSKAQYGKAVGEAAQMFTDAHPTKDKDGFPVAARRKWSQGNAVRYLMNKYNITRAQAVRALKAGGFTGWFKPAPKGPRGPAPGTGPR